MHDIIANCTEAQLVATLVGHFICPGSCVIHVLCPQEVVTCTAHVNVDGLLTGTCVCTSRQFIVTVSIRGGGGWAHTSH